MRFFPFVILLVGILSDTCFGQDAAEQYEFGSTTYRELEMKTYEKDTAAAAVVLQEFAHATIDNGNDHNLILTYYVRIKILKKAGLEKANVSLMMQKNEGRQEVVRNIQASSFNFENGTKTEMKLQSKNIFSENYNKYWDLKKFAIPNVRVGSVIEYEYELETPFFVSTFRPWEFQTDIPKVQSEYWATIPANYRYNIALKGLLKLSKQEDKVLKDYFSPGGGHKADCVRFMWGMKDIPAFIEEEYMTARRNFVSAINFELEEVQYFDGRKDKITKEWKDAEQELRQRDDFGIQLKRGKDVVDGAVESLVAGESDPLEKAKKIYAFIRGWYRWNEYTGKFSEFGIKKAFEKREGNVGDINLSLIAAMRYAQLPAEPVILATRDKGLPTELFPVLTDFNYVIAKVTIGDKFYLLDATDDFVPFGVLPERCLNGNGRVLGEKESSWLELKPQERAKQISILNLKLNEDGTIRGTMENTFYGYRGADVRRKIYSFENEELFYKDWSKSHPLIQIEKHSFGNLEEFSKPLKEKLEITLEPLDLSAPVTNVNLMLVERWMYNPFKSNERLFPVDFGTPFEEVVLLNLELPETMELVDPPVKQGIALPNGGGRFVYDVVQQGNKIQLNSSLLVSRAIYGSNEYFHLKEFFSRVVATQGTDLLLRKRPAGK